MTKNKAVKLQLYRLIFVTLDFSLKWISTNLSEKAVAELIPKALYSV